MIRKKKPKNGYNNIFLASNSGRPADLSAFFVFLTTKNCFITLLLRVVHYDRCSLVLFFSGHSSRSYTFHGFRFAFAAKLAVFLLILLATFFPTVPLHVTPLAPVIRHFAAQTKILAVLWCSEMKDRVSYDI